MNQYWDIVQKMLIYLKTRNQCASSRKSHQQCYEELGNYLEENGLTFSEDSTKQWVQSIKEKHNRQRVYFWSQYVRQLVIFYHTGSVPDELFYQILPVYEKVPEYLKVDLDRYLEHCRPQYTERSFELAKIHCSGIMCYLTEQGLVRMDELTFQMVDKLFHADLGCTDDTKALYLQHARAMLRYLSEYHTFPIDIFLVLNSKYNAHIGHPNQFSRKHQDRIEQLKAEDMVLTVQEFHSRISVFIVHLREIGYGTTQTRYARQCLTELYLFLSIHNLWYHPEIAQIWLEELKPTAGTSWKQRRRILYLFQQDCTAGLRKEATRSTYHPDILETFPQWCQIPVQGFMNRLLREFRSISTARNYKFSCLHFCRFLIQQGVEGFNAVTPAHIRLFTLTDEHATAYGRATSYAVVRQFLRYLEEQQLIQTGLHQGIFTKYAQSTDITDILDDTQLQRIQDYRKAAETPMELRTVAMVTVSLELGLRASDVTELKFQNIDWKQRKISLIQKKTGNSLILPLTIASGNAIYRYLQNGRPETDSPYLFVHHHAPYGKMSTKICNNSLYRILPERAEVHHKGFHVLRRTFATNLLRKGAGIPSMIDSLGHTDPTTIMQYLSFDEERMRLCPLSLQQCSILLEGGML